VSKNSSIPIILFFLNLDSCTDPSFRSSKQNVNHLSYYKDYRTNLCFVKNEIHTENAFIDEVFVNVPCTSEVEKLVGTK